MAGQQPKLSPGAKNRTQIGSEGQILFPSLFFFSRFCLSFHFFNFVKSFWLDEIPSRNFLVKTQAVVIKLCEIGPNKDEIDQKVPVLEPIWHFFFPFLCFFSKSLVFINRFGYFKALNRLKISSLHQQVVGPNNNLPHRFVSKAVGTQICEGGGTW